jgi:hypothetical protein
MAKQGVGARNINKPKAQITVPHGTAFTLNGFARPVARMHAHSRKGVKKRAFPHVGIARKGNNPLPPLPPCGVIFANTHNTSVLIYRNILRIAAADGDHLTAYKIRPRVTHRAFTDTPDLCPRRYSNVQKSAVQLPRAAKSDNAASFTNSNRCKSFVLRTIHFQFRPSHTQYILPSRPLCGATDVRDDKKTSVSYP